MTQEDDEPEISDLAMSIMGSIAYGGPMPRTISESEVGRLSEYECLVIDKAIRKRGLTLRHDMSEGEFTIEDNDR